MREMCNLFKEILNLSLCVAVYMPLYSNAKPPIKAVIPKVFPVLFLMFCLFNSTIYLKSKGYCIT